MLVGAHVSVAGGVDNAIDRQREIGGNCGQIFTHSPQVWDTPSISEEQTTSFRDQTDAELKGPWVIHSSYLVNLATPKEDLRARSIENLQAELDAAAQLEIPYLNIHLGAHTGAGEEQGLENAATALDELAVPTGVQVLIESDAGSGTKLGGEFEHLATVLDRSDQDLGICLDTAHSFVAGYDLSDAPGVEDTLATFEDVVGLEQLKCIHLNDSAHERGSHSDEHAHLGEGEIGAEGIKAVINNDDLRDLPFILETPNEEEKGFAENIEVAKSMRA